LITSVAENHWNKIGKLGLDSKEIPSFDRYAWVHHHIEFGGYYMKKSSLFISTVLTTFVLAILGGVFSLNRAYSRIAHASAPQPTQLPGAVPATPGAIPTLPATISPQEAAQISARITGYGKLYSVESTQFGGLETYKVTFSSGNTAYIDMQGQLVAAFLAARSGNSLNTSLPTSDLGSSANSESDDHEGGD
jgi:hypothetical protein